MSFSCPQDVRIEELIPELAEVINSHWPEVHRFPGSVNFLVQLIKNNGGLGIFSKNTNELRAWITINDFGALSTLQTLDQYKKKGYASLLTKQISKNRAVSGSDTIAFILHSNFASISLFEKLGFVNVNDLKCIQFANTEY